MPSVFLVMGTKLLKLLLLLHYQFLHGGTTSKSNIQTPEDLNEDYLSPHTLHTAQIWSQIIVVLLLVEQAMEPLLMISINNNVIYSHDTHQKQCYVLAIRVMFYKQS